MTEAEAKKLKKAARLYGKAEYDLGTGAPDIGKTTRLWMALVALIESMIEEPKE